MVRGRLCHILSFVLNAINSYSLSALVGVAGVFLHDRMEELRYLCLKIVEKNEQICTVKFQNFLGAMPQTPILGRGYGAPPQTQPPRHSGALRLARGLWPLHRPSLCVVDILRYFRP